MKPNTDIEAARTLFLQLYENYHAYREPYFTHRRFKHKEIEPLIQELATVYPFEVSVIGTSLEKRPIYQVKAGNGPIPILLWSQMHGDEATATMALFDIFNFLRVSGDGLDTLRHDLLTKTTLYFIPMLNPDGAERFQRRTALDIDMNRDALRLQSPESAVLKERQQTLKPLVGFNLHDQNPRYTVGTTGKQAVMSFLATAYDQDRNINDVRKRSMQLIVSLNRLLQAYIPNQVARFDDEFEPRAFGDNIQKWGTTLILVESGGYKGDPEKMYIRRLNVVALLTAMGAIANETYVEEDISAYQAIPENGRTLLDVLIRNAQVICQGHTTRMDIGILRHEENTAGAADFYYRSVIDDLGDLSTFYGLQEIDATGLTILPPRVYPDVMDNPEAVAALELDTLRDQGIVVFRVKDIPANYKPVLPVHIVHEGKPPETPLCLGQIPTFLLADDTRIRYVFVNGFAINTMLDIGYQVTGVVD
ncbi:M14 family zinc carboxypeptidase [Arsenicibacter rosenii]|uniref:Peptidase M14 n=1 Tax=Arsenicibacter rosenii TaxID=1750698 RepID=A0A1S2VMM7_9BACT|nr:M14 family zinc carboxypeptidase [Arsenicibacter rosenii]OIN60022.1 peptidase M14 [Arsenicibacter rosenii]